MKEILAIVRMNRMNQTKEALAKAGFPALHAISVLGRGKGQVDYRLLRGAEAGAPEAIALLGQGPQLIPKRMISMIVPDDKVRLAVSTIIDRNSTGTAGDGKIFVLPISDAVRIRTGEAGAAAIDEADGRQAAL